MRPKIRKEVHAKMLVNSVKGGLGWLFWGWLRREGSDPRHSVGVGWGVLGALRPGGLRCSSRFFGLVYSAAFRWTLGSGRRTAIILYNTECGKVKYGSLMVDGCPTLGQFVWGGF